MYHQKALGARSGPVFAKRRARARGRGVFPLGKTTSTFSDTHANVTDYALFQLPKTTVTVEPSSTSVPAAGFCSATIAPVPLELIFKPAF